MPERLRTPPPTRPPQRPPERHKRPSAPLKHRRVVLSEDPPTVKDSSESKSVSWPPWRSAARRCSCRPPFLLSYCCRGKTPSVRREEFLRSHLCSDRRKFRREPPTRAAVPFRNRARSPRLSSPGCSSMRAPIVRRACDPIGYGNPIQAVTPAPRLRKSRREYYPLFCTPRSKQSFFLQLQGRRFELATLPNGRRFH